MQVIWGRRPITSLDDIKGVKLRVASPEQGEFVRRFGGVSITMGAPEVPSALDRGVVDGILTGGVGAVLWKDLLKSGYLLVVNVNNSYIIANADAFKKLSPELQAKLRKAVEENARWNQETMRKEEEAATAELKSIGYNNHAGQTRGRGHGRRPAQELLGRMGQGEGAGTRGSPRQSALSPRALRWRTE